MNINEAVARSGDGAPKPARGLKRGTLTLTQKQARYLPASPLKVVLS